MNTYLSTESIKELHVEISTLCNAACPMCARNNNGAGLAPNLIENQWSLDDIDKVFSKDLTSVNHVTFCGTHGDPIAARYLFEAVEKAKSLGCSVEIFTNGSLRSNTWWEKFCNLFDTHDKIIFGIDGVATNHLYRQNTDITKVLDHLEIACKSKVRTQWDFLAFKHNEHEIDTCQEYATKIGVDSFRIRKTARFTNDKFPVLDINGVVTHYLEPPDNVELRHPDYVAIKELYKKLPDSYNIDCIYKKTQRIYVNSRLEVFPCCYISDVNEVGKLNLNLSVLKVPLDKFSLRHDLWDTILEHQFYKNDLVESFTNGNTLPRCVFTCGVVSRERNQSNKPIKLKKT